MQQYLREVQEIPLLIVTGAKDRCAVAAEAAHLSFGTSECSLVLAAKYTSSVLTRQHICRITTPQHAAVICNKLSQECTCMILPGVGHLSNEEAPRLLNACLATFCKHAFTSLERVSGEDA